MNKKDVLVNGDSVGAKTLAHLRGGTDLETERKRLKEARKTLKSRLVHWLERGLDEHRKKVFWKMVDLLQEDSRMKLTKMSKEMGVPISTLHQYLNEIRKHFCFTVALKKEDELALNEMVTPCSEFCYYYIDSDMGPKEVDALLMEYI